LSNLIQKVRKSIGNKSKEKLIIIEEAIKKIMILAKRNENPIKWRVKSKEKNILFNDDKSTDLWHLSFQISQKKKMKLLKIESIL